MSTKRVILANHPRLVGEMFHHVIARAEHLEVVHELIGDEDLPRAIQRFCPEWVIVSLPLSSPVLEWISAFLQSDDSVRFIFLSPDQHTIKLKLDLASEADLSNFSLKEFIYLLEKDLLHN